MPSLFGGITGKNSATYFDIRLDNDLVILRGEESEASSQMLSGKVILCLPSQLKVEDVHLRLTGTLKVGWTDTKVTASGVANNRVERTTIVLDHRFAPFVGGDDHGKGSSSKGLVLQAGNYEWPFEYVVPGSMPESVEGMTESHLSYKLKATVARGRLAYDLHAYKPVRLIRTLDPAALELAHAMTVENIWPNKIEYSIVIPQKAIIFGTNIHVDMRFTSLLKRLKIGTIKCFLVESQEFTIQAQQPGVHDRIHKSTRDVGTWQFELNDEEHYRDLIDETGQDGYTISKDLPLPKSLRKCLQDCETNGIKIRHKVKFNVALHNPDGHTSELRATLPVHIFISPNMPLDEQGDLRDQTPNMTQSVNIDSHAPPLYGEHVLDQLYADLDNSGIMTPAPQSGMATPFYSQSQAGSAEDLHSLAGIANGAVHPHALSNRLQGLAASSRNQSFLRLHAGDSISGTNTPIPDDHPISRGQSGYEQNHSGSHASSVPLSRRTSEEEHPPILVSGTDTPEHLDLVRETHALSKVPSYTTAVKQPVRGMSYTEMRSLPNYEQAISRPASPVRDSVLTPGSSVSTGYFDVGLHSGSAGSGTPVTDHGSIARSVRSALDHARTPFQHPGVPRTNSSDADASRRFHLLQVRGRAH